MRFERVVLIFVMLVLVAGVALAQNENQTTFDAQTGTCSDNCQVPSSYSGTVTPTGSFKDASGASYTCAGCSVTVSAGVVSQIANPNGQVSIAGASYTITGGTCSVASGAVSSCDNVKTFTGPQATTIITINNVPVEGSGIQYDQTKGFTISGDGHISGIAVKDVTSAKVSNGVLDGYAAQDGAAANGVTYSKDSHFTYDASKKTTTLISGSADLASPTPGSKINIYPGATSTYYGKAIDAGCTKSPCGLSVGEEGTMILPTGNTVILNSLAVVDGTVQIGKEQHRGDVALCAQGTPCDQTQQNAVMFGPPSPTGEETINQKGNTKIKIGDAYSITDLSNYFGDFQGCNAATPNCNIQQATVTTVPDSYFGITKGEAVVLGAAGGAAVGTALMLPAGALFGAIWGGSATILLIEAACGAYGQPATGTGQATSWIGWAFGWITGREAQQPCTPQAVVTAGGVNPNVNSWEQPVTAPRTFLGYAIPRTIFGYSTEVSSRITIEETQPSEGLNFYTIKDADGNTVATADSNHKNPDGTIIVTAVGESKSIIGSINPSTSTVKFNSDYTTQATDEPATAVKPMQDNAQVQQTQPAPTADQKALLARTDCTTVGGAIFQCNDGAWRCSLGKCTKSR